MQRRPLESSCKEGRDAGFRNVETMEWMGGRVPEEDLEIERERKSCRFLSQSGSALRWARMPVASQIRTMPESSSRPQPAPFAKRKG